MCHKFSAAVLDLKKKPKGPTSRRAHKSRIRSFFYPKVTGITYLFWKTDPVWCASASSPHQPVTAPPAHSRGSWEGIKEQNYARHWLFASVPWRWLSRVSVRTLRCLSHWQSNSLNVCRFHTALGRHNDAQAKFARLHNCPLIVSQEKH